MKEGAPTAIMSSYNLINGVHAANSKDLCTRIAREEWGFDGVIMSDWNTQYRRMEAFRGFVWQQEMILLCRGIRMMIKTFVMRIKKENFTEKEIRLCADRILKLIRRLS